jgi:hypothetical protein
MQGPHAGCSTAGQYEISKSQIVLLVKRPARLAAEPDDVWCACRQFIVDSTHRRQEDFSPFSCRLSRVQSDDVAQMIVVELLQTKINAGIGQKRKKAPTSDALVSTSRRLLRGTEDDGCSVT